MSIRQIRSAAPLILLLVPAAVQAQTPAAAAIPPPPACVAPKLVDRMSVPADDIAHLETQANEFGHCMKAYIDARQAGVQAATAQAKAEADAGNAAAHQVNDLYAAVKAYAAKHAKD